LGWWADQPGRDASHEAWLSGLREKGWIEGKNLLVEYRFAPDRLPALAAELVVLTPDLIIASGPAVHRHDAADCGCALQTSRRHGGSRLNSRIGQVGRPIIICATCLKNGRPKNLMLAQLAKPGLVAKYSSYF
jgi:hypothetical protein